MNRILLIARREYLAYVRTVGFWLSLLSFPLFVVAAGAVPVLLRSSEPVPAVAVIEQGKEARGLASAITDALTRDARRREERIADAATNLIPAGSERSAAGSALASLSRPAMRLVEAPPALAALPPGPQQDEAVRRLLDPDAPADRRLAAVVFLSRQGGELSARVWTARANDNTVEGFVREALKDYNQRATLEAAGISASVLQRAENFRPQVTAFSPHAASGGEISMSDKLPASVGLVGGYLLWALVITGASMLMHSVIEEKSNRILEILLSSASATEILAGKVLGVALLTLSVLSVWCAIGLAGLISAAPVQAAQVVGVLWSGGLLAWFAAFMVGGYLMYAVMFAAIGAFCETPRDAQTLMRPIMMVLIVPLITMQMAVNSPDAPIVRLLSSIPMFTPFLMMARIPSQPPLYESLAALAGMFAFALFMIWVAGRAFRTGALSDARLDWRTFILAVRGDDARA